MRLQCRREDLSRALVVPASVAPSKSPKPSLLAIKLSAADNQVTIEASDGTLWVEARCAATVSKSGDVALPAETLVTIVNSIQADTVSLEVQGRFCEVRSEDALYNLVTLDASDFPSAPPTGEPSFEIDRAELEVMHTRTSFACGKDVGRYALAGVYLEVEDQILTMVATDGRRLARTMRRVRSLHPTNERLSTVVPARAMAEILRGTAGDESVSVAIDEENITFIGQSVVITAKRVVGDFPDHRRIVPQDHLGHFVVDRDMLMSAVRKTAIFSGDVVKFIHLDVVEGCLTFVAEAEGRGRASTKMSADIDGAKQLSVDLNPDFLLDYLKTIPSGALNVDFRDSQGALLMRHVDQQDVYLLMPITAN
jgi:DNA polymerase-3 subunit beta